MDVFAYLGLTTVTGGILGVLARARRWKVGVGGAMLPIAAIAALLSGLSPIADAGGYLFAMLVFSIMGVFAFLTVCFGNPAGNGRGRFDNRNGSLPSGGFGGSSGFGGSGASGTWET